MWNQSRSCSACVVQVQRQVAHVLAAVGQEHHLLVHLHPLGAQHLEQPPLRLAVVGLDEAEALGWTICGHALARDHLEPPIPLGPLLAGVDVAAVQANGQGQVGPWEGVQVPLAAIGEHRLLGAELVFQSLGSRLRVALDSRGVQGPAQRQRLGQQLGTQPVGDQPGELALQIQQLRRGPLRQRCGQGAERARRLRLARAVIPARAGQAHRAEQGADDDRLGVFVGAGSATVRAGHLLGQARADLFVDHDGLHLLQQILGLGQVQAQRGHPQLTPLDLRHLVHCRVLVAGVIGLDDQLDTDPHAALLVACPNCAN
jgi:hypothetical protein